MLGYTADYQAGEISLQEDELLHADFYSAENLPDLPPKLSLSRQLTELVLGET
jgi:NAD+ diphosphatase